MSRFTRHLAAAVASALLSLVLLAGAVGPATAGQVLAPSTPLVA